MYDYSNYARAYDYTTTSMDSSEALAVLAGLGTTIMVVSLIVAVISIVSMWKIFTKAGKPGWAAIVPIYNIIVLFQISGLNPLMILLMLIPIANIVVMFLLYIKLAKAFGKGTGFGIGLVFLNIIFMPILAFSDAQYQGAE